MSAKEPEYDEDYVYYLARHPEFRAYAQSRMEGTSGRQRVAWQSLAEFEFDYPDKDIRKEAGKSLKEIDDKVALNAKTNQTLEQIAQAIFKSWFVDFEPVKAKIAVLEAGLPAPRAGIFYTYVIECNDGSLYIGQTDNLKRRWHEHLNGKGAQWTKTHPPVRIAHFEENTSREEAVAKEKEWKTTAGRREIKKLIASGAARQAGGTAEQAELAAMSVISAKDEAALKQLQADQPEADAQGSANVAGGRMPGATYAELAQTAALFPSAMEESELGEIPAGWDVSTIGEEVKIAGGGTPSTKNPVYWENGSINWTTPKDLSNLTDKVLTRTERKITESGLEKISSGLLPIDTVLMSSRAPVGYLALAKIPVAINQGYIAMQCEKLLPPEFVLQWASSNMDEIKQRASGTTFAEISKKNFRPISIIVPSEQIVTAYSTTAKNIYEKIHALAGEIKTLESLRDTLLPKLLSGEIDLSQPMTNRMSASMETKTELYISGDGELQLAVALDKETVWLSQAQMADLFGTKRPAITKHLSNIFKTGELTEAATCSILEHVAEHGQTYKTKHYNLDAIISVGYRVNSARATQFRIWATKTLKQYLVEGYTLNQKRLQERGIEFEQVVSLLSRTLANQQLVAPDGKAVLSVINDYARSWSLLQGYDEQNLKAIPDKQADMQALALDDVLAAIAELKKELIAKGEATELFGQLRGDGLASAVSTIEQGFGDELFYPNAASRAAHLLYFVIKNHPLADGNKRSGSFLFLWYLRINQHLLAKPVEQLINDNTLVALALLVAESQAGQKELMIRLVEHFVLLKEETKA